MEPVDVTITDYHQMVELFHSETDRGAAVLAGSYMENFLGIYLRSRMHDSSLSDKMFSSTGPLATFAQRIDFSQAFGFLPPGVCTELHLIRKIRNHFAHHPKTASFALSPVRDWAASLRSAKEMQMPNGGTFKLDDSKVAYLISAGLIVVMIHNQMLKQAQ